MSAIGRLQPLTLDQPQPVEGPILQRVEDHLGTQLGSQSQAAAMVAFMSGVLRCPGRTFSVPTIQRAVPKHRSVTTRQLRYLLDHGNWNRDDLRLTLIAAAVEAGVEAIYLECHEVNRRGIIPYDVVTISLLGRNFSCPVGWLRAEMGRWDQQAMAIGEAERTAAAVLLAQLCNDLERLGLEPDFAPLLACDSRYGEMTGFRADLDALGFEYVLALNETYNSGYEGSGHPEDPVLAERELVEQLPFRADGGIPVPRPVPPGPDPAPLGELFIPYRSEGAPAYAIGHPKVRLRPGELIGHRAIGRARELGVLIAEIAPPQAAACLRLPGFLHGPEVGWQAGALLLSVLVSALQGLPPDTRT
jgi:hypothetical protein